MIKQKIRRVLSLAGASLLLALSFSQFAAAAGGNGLRVSPVRTDATVDAGTSKTIPITVTNVTTSVANLQVIVNDFIANPNESGDPSLILDPKQYANSHSLKRFIQPIPDFTLGPGQQKQVNVVVKVPATAAGGGYFGAVRFAPAGSSSTNQTVSLAGSVASLILVKVPGDIKDQMSIASFDARKNDRPSTIFFSNKGIAAVARFQNEGNVQEAPFGKILLKNNSGKVIASYEMNNTDPRGNVLPDSIRKFTVQLGDKVGSVGKYRLEGNFGYGTSGQLLSASTTFYVIPFIYIILFVALVLAIVFFVFGMPRIVRAYNRRVLRKAGRR